MFLFKPKYSITLVGRTGQRVRTIRGVRKFAAQFGYYVTQAQVNKAIVSNERIAGVFIVKRAR